MTSQGEQHTPSTPTVDDTVSESAPAVLPLVADLARSLHDAGISYCHWKSNAALDRSLSGRNDLDLLVDRADLDRFLACLHALGFHAARIAPERHVPGLLDYYGYDPASQRLLHVHLHTHLVLGDDETKNYRLPIEGAYLASVGDPNDPAFTIDGVTLPVPAPELEYLVLVLRLVLKHCPWDALLARKGRPTASERNELTYLEAQLDPARLDRTIRALLPFVDPARFARWRRALGRSGPLERVVAGHEVQKALARHGRRSPTADTATKGLRRLRRAVRTRLGVRTPKRRPQAGGLVVAIVGGDGSGKSSAVEHVATLLGHDLDVRRRHLGKPPRSFSTRVVRKALRPARAAGKLAALDLPPWQAPERFPGYGVALWHLTIALDRRAEYRRIREWSGHGTVVICDRFPLPGIERMDGPRLDRLPGVRTRPVARALAGIERRCYAEMLPPDVLVVLRVTPEVAVARRPEQDREFVYRRAEEVFGHDWTATGAIVVDADRPQHAVLAEVTAAVWRHL